MSDEDAQPRSPSPQQGDSVEASASGGEEELFGVCDSSLYQVGHQTFDCEPEDEMIDHGQSREASIDEAIKQKKAVADERTQESVVIGQASALSKAVQTATEMTFGKRNRISGRYGKGIMKLVYNHLRQGLRCKAYAKAFD